MARLSGPETSNKRPYNSGNRKAQATQTKGRILDMARDLFCTNGFEGVTVQALAQQAGVSEPLIYGLFQSKRGILRALMDEALPQEHYNVLIAQACEGKNYKKRLQVTAKICRLMYEAEKTQMDLLRTASAIAPEFKELEREREERRYKRQAESMEALYNDKVVKRELNLTQARDILWVLTGRDLYRLLVIDRGWCEDAYEAWLGNLLVISLLEDIVG
jgi:AcrR family transcriptional regulator